MGPVRLPSAALVVLLLGACGGGDTRVCVGSDDFCRDAFGRNRPPDADAGPDQQVVAGERVLLDGSDSHDPDGRITSYSWTERSGAGIALENADDEIASFTAPSVDARTVLEFRLVVTDDDRASDDDRVHVTVLPAEAAALQVGLELLKTVHHPGDATAAPACGACWMNLGLWLGARVLAAEAGADADVDELLDALRLIEQLHTGVLPEPPLEPRDRQLFVLGQTDVARFTAARDPAAAELAQLSIRPAASRRIAVTADHATASATAWRDALAARAELAWLVAPGGRRRAAALLLGDPRSLDAATVAAATLVLALP